MLTPHTARIFALYNLATALSEQKTTVYIHCTVSIIILAKT